MVVWTFMIRGSPVSGATACSGDLEAVGRYRGIRARAEKVESLYQHFCCLKFLLPVLACAHTRHWQSSRFLRFILKGTQMRAQRLEKLALTHLCPRNPNRLLCCKLKSKKVVQEIWYSVRARINNEGKLTCTIMSFGKRS